MLLTAITISITYNHNKLYSEYIITFENDTRRRRNVEKLKWILTYLR